jgi:hypothetical protein
LKVIEDSNNYFVRSMYCIVLLDASTVQVNTVVRDVCSETIRACQPWRVAMHCVGLAFRPGKNERGIDKKRAHSSQRLRTSLCEKKSTP